MAVCCRRCGREYDVALFEFGRTIWCACGNRVGIEPRVRPARQPTERRFAADAMLGRLARWLRLLGFDCVHHRDITDEEMARLGALDGRTILTRDRGLPEEWWLSDIYVVHAEELTRQLVEVVKRFDLAPSFQVLTRCSDCNRLLQRAPRSDVGGRVPPGILERHDVFRECRDCGRVFWEGSHAARIRTLAEKLADA